jgi:hypothetical protein
MKKKIYLYLCGGLGNQLFQYAAAKNIAIINDADLIIDTQCGFITDFRDFWKFSLSVSNLKNVILKKNILVFWLYRIYKKIFGICKIFNFFIFRNLINEMCIDYFDEKIKRFNFKNRLYLFGYFQSEKYFVDNKNSIVNELNPPVPTKNIFLEMKDKIVNSNSISLGVRLHETMPQDISYKVGGITPFDFYKNAVILMLKKIPNPTFFIFSTSSSNVEKLLLDFVEIKKFNIHVITEDMGFNGASDNLWLMSHCVNHVISNSTLYWWAVYLSSFKYKDQKIICADNFANKDTCLELWKLKNFK